MTKRGPASRLLEKSSEKSMREVRQRRPVREGPREKGHRRRFAGEGPSEKVRGRRSVREGPRENG